ncbi:MAG: histidine--tRNA ligase [candidate division KSB1 bacterium]|nr:histidine--tRNA ligase [candidate division KSB1 bacterium]MDZ7274556.1 histidine--tRNA ligase [candidate division KSB1 bacterium]MDZ7284783.1 histidine--tRNA ligase [candidate division KSB1 bacterium]MDZ7297797.1 histidine--tRNA ligase [candidate division KSB1 bacterium]MDZ7306414.1 histidine--tRNA ligase [candidate division KSB1 bacterium]
MINVQPPSGTRDFLADELRKRRQVIRVIQEVYESFGFEPLETPAFENLSTLLGKYGEEGDQLLFRILRRGEKLQEVLAAGARSQNELSDLALRYDLTVPLARVMARYRSQLPRFYKRYQIQPVWRADRPARGRFREFMQCDLDVCGSSSLLVEAEVLAAACTVLDRLQFNAYNLSLNHREILRGLIETAGVPAELEESALVAVDKLDKLGTAGVHAELLQRGLAAPAAEKLLRLLAEVQDLPHNEQRLARLREELHRPAAVAGLEALRTILDLSRDTAAGPRLVISPSLARGLSYYTGAIFEVIVPGAAGSLGGGGRYDGLVGMFAGQAIPACGFSLGLERVVLMMEEQGRFAETAGAVQVMLVNFAETQAEILALARRLRGMGVTCDVHPEVAGLKQQFNYAASRNVQYVAFYGQREKDSGRLRLKRQADGTELTLALEDLESEWRRLTASH